MAQNCSRLSGESSRPRRILTRQRHVRRQGLAEPGDDLQGLLRLAQEIPAAALAQDLLDRAAEVDVDHVEARRDQLQRRRGEVVGRAAHELGRDGMVLVGHADIPPGLVPLGHVEDEAVEQHLADGVARPEPPRDGPGRPVAIAAHRGQGHGELDPHRAEVNRGYGWRWGHRAIRACPRLARGCRPGRDERAYVIWIVQTPNT